jgi:DNA helicase-2/ATP-dependent DNA helicase PcrA
LFLSYAFRRLIFGESTPSIPSRFLSDIPVGLTDGSSARIAQDYSYKQFVDETTWDRPQVLTERQNELRSRVAPLPSSKKELKYKSGQKVHHAKFGDGMVIESQAKSGDEEVTVSFADKKHGIKRLAASFANLTILEG